MPGHEPRRDAERARDPAHLAQAMREIPLGFRLKPATRLLATQPGELPAFRPGEIVSLAIGPATNLRREATIMASRG